MNKWNYVSLSVYQKTRTLEMLPSILLWRPKMALQVRQKLRGLLGVATPNILPLCNQPDPNTNHCVAIVPKLQDLVQLQHQVSPKIAAELLTEYNSLSVVTLDVQHTPLPHTPACTIHSGFWYRIWDDGLWYDRFWC